MFFCHTKIAVLPTCICSRQWRNDREKNILGYKKLQGGKKPIRKTEKSGDSEKFVGAAKNEQGASNGNVTPLALAILKIFQLMIHLLT